MIQCKVVSEEESCPVAGSATDAREMYNLLPGCPVLQVLLNDATLTSSAQSSSTARYIPNAYSSLLQVLNKVSNLGTLL